MSISPSKARALCTESEYTLVKWSSPRNVKTLTPAKLKAKIDRTRKLRDKFRDLAKKQSGEARGKRKPTGARPAKGNERTVQKAELFAQTLDRFQKALDKAEKDSTKTTKKKTKKRQTDFSQSEATPKKSKTKRTNSKTAKKSGTEDASSGKKKASAKPQAKSGKPSSASSPSPTPAPPPIPLATAASSRGSLGASRSFGVGSETNALTGIFASSAVSQQSRETRRREKSSTTKIGREQSRFAATSREKIQGHVSAQTRRSQAKRDSKGG